MWRTLAIESRYSFYRMGWVNSKSERMTEITFPPWVGFEFTTSWSTVQRATTERSPLSCLLSDNGSGCLDASALHVLSVMCATVSSEHRSHIAALKLTIFSLLVTANARAVKCNFILGVFLVWLAMVDGLSSFVKAAVILVIYAWQISLGCPSVRFILDQRAKGE